MQGNNGILSRVLSGQKEIREQIACSGNEDATMDNGKETRSYKRMPRYPTCQHSRGGMIKLEWTHQEKRKRQPLNNNDGHGCAEEEKKDAAYTEMALQHPGRYEKIRINN